VPGHGGELYQDWREKYSRVLRKASGVERREEQSNQEGLTALPPCFQGKRVGIHR